MHQILILAFIYGLGLFKGTTLCLVCYFSSFPLRITYSMQMWPSCSLVNLAYIIEHILILQYKLHNVHKYANKYTRPNWRKEVILMYNWFLIQWVLYQKQLFLFFVVLYLLFIDVLITFLYKYLIYISKYRKYAT